LSLPSALTIHLKEEKKMTKADLIEKISADTEISKALAEKVLNSVTDNVARCLKKGDKITLTGFGTFSVAKRKARTGRNPQTGQVINIKATRVPRFKAGKALKDQITKK
jgi:DNA-binding protein HU-beta